MSTPITSSVTYSQEFWFGVFVIVTVARHAFPCAETTVQPFDVGRLNVDVSALVRARRPALPIAVNPAHLSRVSICSEVGRMNPVKIATPSSRIVTVQLRSSGCIVSNHESWNSLASPSQSFS